MSIENLQKSRPVKTSTKAKIKKNSSSSSSFFYMGMALFLMLIAFLGFWASYFRAILPGYDMIAPMGGVPWVIHVHAAVFIGWLVLLLIETVLIARRRIREHMKLGRYGLFLGAAVFLTGLLVLFLQNYTFISRGEITVMEGIVGTVGVWMQMVNFSLLLYLGYRKRRKPEYHKRYMLFATIAIMPAPIVRLGYYMGYWSATIFVILIGAIMIHDYLRIKHVHKATLVGTALFLIDVVLLLLGFQ